MNDKIQDSIDNSYLFGCIKYKNHFSFYLMPIAYWVLNYEKYDPKYDPKDWEDGIIFRDNILNVDDDNIEPFMESIKVDFVDIESVNISDYNLMAIFLFYIDFDSKHFISYFDDIEIEEYLPSEEWEGIFGDPIKFIPENLKSIFSNKHEL